VFESWIPYHNNSKELALCLFPFSTTAALTSLSVHSLNQMKNPLILQRLGIQLHLLTIQLFETQSILTDRCYFIVADPQLNYKLDNLDHPPSAELMYHIFSLLGKMNRLSSMELLKFHLKNI
jgi:hypothetical protein